MCRRWVSLVVPHSAHPTIDDWAFPVEAVRIWNSLPSSVTSSPSSTAFRWQLKWHMKYLLHSTNYLCMLYVTRQHAAISFVLYDALIISCISFNIYNNNNNNNNNSIYNYLIYSFNSLLTCKIISSASRQILHWASTATLVIPVTVGDYPFPVTASVFFCNCDSSIDFDCVFSLPSLEDSSRPVCLYCFAGKKVVQGLYDYEAAGGDDSQDLSFAKGDLMIVEQPWVLTDSYFDKHNLKLCRIWSHPKNCVINIFGNMCNHILNGILLQKKLKCLRYHVVHIWVLNEIIFCIFNIIQFQEHVIHIVLHWTRSFLTNFADYLGLYLCDLSVCVGASFKSCLQLYVYYCVWLAIYQLPVIIIIIVKERY